MQDVGGTGYALCYVIAAGQNKAGQGRQGPARTHHRTFRQAAVGDPELAGAVVFGGVGPPQAANDLQASMHVGQEFEPSCMQGSSACQARQAGGLSGRTGQAAARLGSARSPLHAHLAGQRHEPLGRRELEQAGVGAAPRGIGEPEEHRAVLVGVLAHEAGAGRGRQQDLVGLQTALRAQHRKAQHEQQRGTAAAAPSLPQPSPTTAPPLTARLMPLSAEMESGAGTAVSSARYSTPLLASSSAAYCARSCRAVKHSFHHSRTTATPRC